VAGEVEGMGVQAGGTHDHPTDPDAGFVAALQDDPTHLNMDGEEGTDDSLMQSPETPPDPLALTVDFDPNHPAMQPSGSENPLLTMNEGTQNGFSSRPSISLGLPTGAAVRHSVPGYEILREIGRGGMGVVYQARQMGLNRLVALKMILSGDHAGTNERDRFRREAEAVAALQHPHIVQIHEIGEVDGRPYLAFEYIEGGSLAQLLGGNPWPPRAAAALVEILARAMQFAHDRGIVHRDLKPGNVLLSGMHQKPADRSKTPSPDADTIDSTRATLLGVHHPKIMDFGLAKRVDPDSEWLTTGDVFESPPQGQTRTGAVMGTPSYIAPEQAAGKNRDVGPPVDVYALGAILYELLTGRPPFRGETALDTVLQVMSEDPVSPRRLQPKIPRDLETICMKCLQKLPGKRYLSASDLADDLQRFLRHEPIAARPINAYERLIKWAKRHPAIATSLFISIFALVSLLSISFWFNFELRDAVAAKESEAAKSREAQLAAERSAREKDEQTRYADERLKEVEKSRKEVEREHQESLKREDQARRTAYALALNRAMALVERDPSRAALLLDKKEECPYELRDFTWHYLRARCRVDQSFIAGHAKSITQIVYSPDASLLAAASWDGTVRVSNAKTLQTIAVLRGHRGIVRSVAFAADGRTLATAGNDLHVMFWEIPPALPPVDENQPHVLKPWSTVDTGDMQMLAIAPEGHQVAAIGADGKLRLLTIPPLPRDACVAAAGGFASFLSRTPEGGHRPEHGPAIPFAARAVVDDVMAGHTGLVTALHWTKDGLYTGGQDRTIRRWSPGLKLEGEIVVTLPESVLSFDIAAGGEFLAVAGSSSEDSSIKIWNLRQGQEVAKLRGHTRVVYSLAFGRDGKLLASASHDGTVRLWEPAIGQERSVYRGHKEPVRSVVFAPDQKMLASGGMDSTVRFWSLAAANEHTFELVGRSRHESAACSSDGRIIALTDRDNLIRVWIRGEAGFSDSIAYLLRGAGKKITNLAVNPAGDKVAAIVGEREATTVMVWSLPPAGKGKGSVELKTNLPLKVNADAYDLALHGNLLAVAGKNGMQIWNVDKKTVLQQPSRGNIQSVAFTPDGGKIVTAGGRLVQVWDVATGREECKMPFGHVREDITAIAVGPRLKDLDPHDGPQIWTVITSDATGASWIWSLAPSARGKGAGFDLIHRAILTGHAEGVTSVTFDPEGKTIATSSEDRTIRLWDPVTGRERAALTSHTDAVLQTVFINKGAALLSVGREGEVKTWLAPRP